MNNKPQMITNNYTLYMFLYYICILYILLYYICLYVLYV